MNIEVIGGYVWEIFPKEVITYYIRKYLMILLLVFSSPEMVHAREIFGTGFAVGDGHYILTAFHVVAGGKAISVSRPDHRGWERVDFIAGDQRLDLALLRAATERPALRFAEWSDVEAGLNVYVIGYPDPLRLGFSAKITAGIFNGVRDVDRSFNLFQISAQIQNGNSGSPVFAPNGLVIGLVASRVNEDDFRAVSGDYGQDINFAIRSDIVKKFLRDNGIIDPNGREFWNEYMNGVEIYKKYSSSTVIVSVD